MIHETARFIGNTARQYACRRPQQCISLGGSCSPAGNFPKVSRENALKLAQTRTALFGFVNLKPVLMIGTRYVGALLGSGGEVQAARGLRAYI